MAIPISQIVCARMALVTIGYSVGLAIHLFRQKNKTFDIAFDDTVERLRTLSALAMNGIRALDPAVACFDGQNRTQ